MIISTNPVPSEDEFSILLENTLDSLMSDARDDEEKYIQRTPSEFEEDVFNFMNESATGTNFDGTLTLLSGRYFPDIVANRYYGVEVKTKHTNTWTTVGNSIFEGSRAEDVERIYLMFGKGDFDEENLSTP